MMGNFDELITILKELLTNRFYPKPEYIKGVLGDGLGNVRVPNRQDFNYARFNRGTNEAFEIFNKSVPEVDGWPILIGEYPWNPGLTQVVGTDWESYLQSGWGDSVSTANPHAPTHEWRDGFIGADPSSIYLRAIAPGRAYVPSVTGSIVYVNAFEYHTGTIWPGTPGIDLQPIMSATTTGSARFAGVYVNPASNTLGVVTGTTDVDTAAFDPPLVTFPWGVIPKARVRLYGGMAGIRESDFRDARRIEHVPFTGTAGGGAPSGLAGGDLTGSYPDPRVAGLHGFPLLSTTPQAGDILMFTGSAWRPIPLDNALPDAVWPVKNRLYHSLTHNLYQQYVTFGTAPNGTYFADLWKILTNSGAGLTLSRQAGGSSDPFSHYMRIALAENSKQFGAVQYLEAQDTYPLRGQVVSLSFEAWASGITTLRATVVEWTGTADAPTAPVAFADWATGNPTLSASWAYSFTPSADITISGTRARHTIPNITIGSTANNIAVFIWTPAAESSGDHLNLANVQLERGAAATDFVARILNDERGRVVWFFEAFGGDDVNEFFGTGEAVSSTTAQPVVWFERKRIVPSFSVSAATDFAVTDSAGTPVSLTSLSFVVPSKQTVVAQAGVASGLVAGDASSLLADSTTAARIFVDARL